MRKIALFSILLAVGLIGSQFLPGLLGESRGVVSEAISFLTMACFSFIMIHVCGLLIAGVSEAVC